jgi:hypothetical protein
MLSSTEEVWKDVVGFEGYYQVSNRGRVKSLSRYISNGRGSQVFMEGRIRKIHVTTTGYYIVNLKKFGVQVSKKVHQLVAIAFLGHIPCGHRVVVDHIDGNPLNNYVENLQLISNRENTSRSKKKGTSKFTGVSWVKSRNKWQVSIYLNNKREFLGNFKDELEAHETYQNRLSEHLASKIN